MVLMRGAQHPSRYGVSRLYNCQYHVRHCHCHFYHCQYHVTISWRQLASSDRCCSFTHFPAARMAASTKLERSTLCLKPQFNFCCRSHLRPGVITCRSMYVRRRNVFGGQYIKLLLAHSSAPTPFIPKARAQW